MTPAPGRCTRSGGLCRLASRAAPAPRDVSVGAMGHGGEDEAEGRAGGGEGGRREEEVEQKEEEGRKDLGRGRSHGKEGRQEQEDGRCRLTKRK